MGGENEVVHTNSESPILIHGESSDEEDEAVDNTVADADVAQSVNPENINSESNGHQSPEGSPVEDMVQTPD